MAKRFYAAPLEGLTSRIVKAISAKPSGAHTSGPAVLTYPVPDYQGDIVEPAGGDWSQYDRDPVVNYDHDVPVGRGEISLASVKINGKRCEVPIGETLFFQSANCLKGLSLNRYDASGNVCGKWDVSECLRAAEQAERLVRDGVVAGVSLEFEPINSVQIGKSLLGKRPAYHFTDWLGLGYAHTPNPVNPHAGLVEQRAEKAIKFVEQTAGLLSVVKKSLTPLLKSVKQGRYIPVRTQPSGRTRKAMEEDDYMAMDVTTDETMDMEGEDMPVEDGMSEETPSVQLMMDGAQQLSDLAASLSDGLSRAEHPKARKYIQKAIDELIQTAADMTAMAEKVKAELSGGQEVMSDMPDGGAEMQLDETGAIMSKSIRYRGKRLAASDMEYTVRKSRKSQGRVEIDKDRYNDLIATERAAKRLLG